MEDQKITLINMKQPQDQIIFPYTKNTLIVDLHQYITKNCETGKIEIYFVENQLFQGSLNLYLYKQLKGSSVYYKIDVSQKQIQSQYVTNNQENLKQFIPQGKEQQRQQQTNFLSSQYEKSEKLCQTEETLILSNMSDKKDQDQNRQQSEQIKIQELIVKLEEQEQKIKNILYEKYHQQKDQEVIIQNLTKQNEELNQQLNYLQKKSQLEQKKIETLQSQIEELKIEKEDQNNKINSLMIQNNIIIQKKQDTEEFKKDQIILSGLNNVDLFEFNEYDQETTETYQNKCGHSIYKSQFDQLLMKAVMNKNIVGCQICNSHFSSKLCLEIGVIGKEYLQMQLSMELPDIYKSCKTFKNQSLNLISCGNSGCNFFCIWQPNIKKLDDDYSYCPNCLRESVKNPKIKTLFQTHY